MKKRKGLWGGFGFIGINIKITGGFIAIYFFFFANSANTVYTVSQGATEIQEFSEVINPSIDRLDEFKQLVLEAQLYSYGWIHHDEDKRGDDREALKEIHLNYDSFNDSLEKLATDWENENLREDLKKAILQFQAIISIQKQILNKLESVDASLDPVTKGEASSLLFNQVLPKSEALLTSLNNITRSKQNDRQETQEVLLEQFQNLVRTVIIAVVLLIFVGFLVTRWTRRQIVRPIKYVNNVFVRIGSGELPNDQHFPFNNDEIGEMATSADRLVMNLRETSEFAEQIGKGNYSASYVPQSNKDVLGNALLNMRDNLARVAEEEQKRKWSTEGQVLFSEILKENTDEIEQISDRVINELVRYLKANQGAVFVVESPEMELNGNGTEPYMTLSACYAWDKKKFLEQKVYSGDGLAGQAWQEKGSIYLDEVPENYVQITSGLGEANPKSILIVPLIHNEEVYGVVELASFIRFKPYQIEFVEKVAENIAAAIASVRINERTRKLLAESTLMTEQMKSQEEEMRQNMEELQSTQEHIEKSQKEAKAKEYLLEASNIVIQTNPQFIIQSYNSLTEDKLHYSEEDFEGMAIEFLFQNYDDIERGIQTLKKGGQWSDFIYLKDKHTQSVFVKVNASPVNDETGKLSKYLFIMDDISDAKS